jgi:hypothetical protein
MMGRSSLASRPTLVRQRLPREVGQHLARWAFLTARSLPDRE